VSIRETYTATITLNVQQLFECHKALCERASTYLNGTDEQYPYRWQDLETLSSVASILRRHLDIIVNGYEDEIATKEATALDDDDAVRRFIEGSK
jgi:hypothetical protein